MGRTTDFVVGITLNRLVSCYTPVIGREVDPGCNITGTLFRGTLLIE